MLVTETSKKVALNWVFYIHYPICFKKDKIKALINLSSKINAMTLIYAAKLGIKICSINVGAQKN